MLSNGPYLFLVMINGLTGKFQLFGQLFTDEPQFGEKAMDVDLIQNSFDK